MNIRITFQLNDKVSYGSVLFFFLPRMEKKEASNQVYVYLNMRDCSVLMWECFLQIYPSSWIFYSTIRVHVCPADASKIQMWFTINVILNLIKQISNQDFSIESSDYFRKANVDSLEIVQTLRLKPQNQMWTYNCDIKATIDNSIIPSNGI